MYIPFWDLYWVPITLVIHYIAKLIIFSTLVFISLAFFKISNIRKIVSIIKLWFFSIVSEIAGISVFYLSEKIFPEIIYEYYIVFSLFAFFLAATISFLMNFFFGLTKTNLSKKEKITTCIWLLLFTAPYLFLIQI